MPSLDATTTAVFTSVGLSASIIYNVFVGLVGSAVSFGLWLVQVSWPFLMALAFILVMLSFSHRIGSLILEEIHSNRRRKK